MGFAPDGTLRIANESGSTLLFYQHHTGEIRWMQHIAPSTWEGGTADHVVVSDAKNATPISMVANIASSDDIELHLFCELSTSQKFVRRAHLVVQISRAIIS